MESRTSADEPLMIEPMAMAAFLVGLLGLILPVIPAIVALVLANTASRRIADSHQMIGGMNWVRGAQALAVLNLVIFAGIIAAAIYLTS